MSRMAQNGVKVARRITGLPIWAGAHRTGRPTDSHAFINHIISAIFICNIYIYFAFFRFILF